MKYGGLLRLSESHSGHQILQSGVLKTIYMKTTYSTWELVLEDRSLRNDLSVDEFDYRLVSLYRYISVALKASTS